MMGASQPPMSMPLSQPPMSMPVQSQPQYHTGESSPHHHQQQPPAGAASFQSLPPTGMSEHQPVQQPYPPVSNIQDFAAYGQAPVTEQPPFIQAAAQPLL